MDVLEPTGSVGLPLTGERTLPGIPHENYWFRRHQVVYQFILDRLADGTVIEVGCGEGYGSALLATSARRVLGIDYDALAVEHCARQYPEVDFVRGNLAALPVRDGTADAVVSLQVIEHVWDHPQFVRQCLRSLRPGGQFIVSTPNRLTFSPDNDGTTPPTNPFHTHEFTAVELIRLLVGCGFTDVTLLGLHAGPNLKGLDDVYGGSFVAAQLTDPPASWPDRLAADVAAVGTGDFVIRVDPGVRGAVAATPGSAPDLLSYPDADGSLDLLVIATA
ncbi:methyltransferase family protein [Jatrophihabitans sp. GAS493]|uniref:class I SAM-dependent methyltransferase n=1 Tax=Jatrophihabitans sp. GAS493 TaxID=1907575 RepID=UPI000BB6B68C|nr:class I SAM-dependent methyltransferase [Jatrophihabitans sp. GAS493]SOD73361.1 methyltransferase family protein [Jatrophihabitans sp. GAS493]